MHDSPHALAVLEDGEILIEQPVDELSADELSAAIERALRALDEIPHTDERHGAVNAYLGRLRVASARMPQMRAEYDARLIRFRATFARLRSETIAHQRPILGVYFGDRAELVIEHLRTVRGIDEALSKAASLPAASLSDMRTAIGVMDKLEHSLAGWVAKLKGPIHERAARQAIKTFFS